ncbi:MAG TPA: MerR family transcriptional regulator [Gammaproteobacteria bacterium]|jgi:DNA-binding transcriptional MerR regulator|nr:MerR family transcriptional regulator [Gammaproteobacteria bacterium]
MQKQYSIRELADEFDVTTRTLRFYEEKGLLSPLRTNQMRSYTSADRTRLRLILRGKRLGLSLEESSKIILMYDQRASNDEQLQALVAKIREKRQQLAEQQKDLELMLLDLRDAEERCLDALSNNQNEDVA